MDSSIFEECMKNVLESLFLTILGIKMYTVCIGMLLVYTSVFAFCLACWHA